MTVEDEKKCETESIGITSEDMSLLTRKLGEFGMWTPKMKTPAKIICFKCKGEGHVKKDFPNNQRSEIRKRNSIVKIEGKRNTRPSIEN